MRDSCKNCVQKHLGQAAVLIDESRNGYPLHRFLAIGHMAEAEAESVKDCPIVAKSIREERHRFDNDNTYNIDFLSLFQLVESMM